MVVLDRYLARINFEGDPAPTADTLKALHLAHSETIPFENLDIHLGIPLQSDVRSLFDKMVLHRRGGYCFEQNGLLSAMLETIGFKVRSVLGRTTFGAPTPRPRGHLLSLVEIGERFWIADVGFGGYGLLEPVPFEIGPEHEAGGEIYRIIPTEGGGFEVEMKGENGWMSLYWFDTTPCYTVDVDVMNFYHSHAEASFFYKNRVVALARRDGRYFLTNSELKIIRGSHLETRQIEDEATYSSILAEIFGIVLPDAAEAKLRFCPPIARTSRAVA